MVKGLRVVPLYDIRGTTQNLLKRVPKKDPILGATHMVVGPTYCSQNGGDFRSDAHYNSNSEIMTPILSFY